MASSGVTRRSHCLHSRLLMAWFVRFSIRMLGILALMLLVEFASYLLYRERGLARVLWVPVSFALVALAGFDTVKRLPLVWGALIGALLAGATNLLSWPIGSYVLYGQLRVPDEAEPLLMATSLLIAAIVGAIVGVVAGLVARDRRRRRSRRSAISKLAYTAFDEPMDAAAEEPVVAIAMPMADESRRKSRGQST